MARVARRRPAGRGRAGRRAGHRPAGRCLGSRPARRVGPPSPSASPPSSRRPGTPTLLADADVYGGVVAQVLGFLDEAPGLAAAARLANNGQLDVAGAGRGRARRGARPAGAHRHLARRPVARAAAGRARAGVGAGPQPRRGHRRRLRLLPGAGRGAVVRHGGAPPQRRHRRDPARRRHRARRRVGRPGRDAAAGPGHHRPARGRARCAAAGRRQPGAQERGRCRAGGAARRGARALRRRARRRVRARRPRRRWTRACCRPGRSARSAPSHRPGAPSPASPPVWSAGPPRKRKRGLLRR